MGRGIWLGHIGQGLESVDEGTGTAFIVDHTVQFPPGSGRWREYAKCCPNGVDDVAAAEIKGNPPELSTGDIGQDNIERVGE